MTIFRSNFRHGERSEAIQGVALNAGLPRFARNDGVSKR